MTPEQPAPHSTGTDCSSDSSASTLYAAALAGLQQPPRNWSRVFPVRPSIRREWEDVEALLLVLRRRELSASSSSSSS